MGKDVHVLYVLTKLELGGAQKICLKLLDGLKKDASLISGAEGTLVSEVKKYDSVFLLKSFRREVGIKTFFLEFVSFFKMISIMRKLKKKHKNLIVHTHSTKAGIMGRWAAFFARVKKRVHTVHGFGFHDYQNKIVWAIHFLFEYLTSLVTTHYICVSNADRKTGQRLFPKFKKKSSIIRAAVEWNLFHPATKSTFDAISSAGKNKFVFGTVSCFKPQKNLIDLLKAFTQMHKKLSPENQRRVHLQIAGDGVQRQILESWIAKHATNIELLGWRSDVADLMKTWDAFVMSSLWEGLPCAVVEARLSRLPVISYKIAGIPEVIKHKHNGFLIKPGKWEKLAEHMQILVEDQTAYEKMCNYKDNLHDFKDATMIEKHIKLYRRMV